MIATTIGGRSLPASARTRTAVPGLTLGIDVGGTKISSVVTDAYDRLLLQDSEPTQVGLLGSQVTAIVRRVVAQFVHHVEGPIGAIGVAIPGHVETSTGKVGLAVNLGGTDIALGTLIEESVGLPCYVEHDARAAVTWLQRSHAGDMAYLSVGTGMSAGIVLDGRVLRGVNGLAGEIGHVVADPDGVACACGLNGCAEAIAAGPAIARVARDVVAQGRATTLTSRATAADVFRAAAAGDEVGQELALAAAQGLARTIRGLVLTLGVDRVVIGGGVAAAGDALLDRITEALAYERSISPLVEAAFSRTIIEVLEPNVEAGARGAAAIARWRIEATLREGVSDR